MIDYIKRNKESLFLLVIEIVLIILGALALVDDIVFLITKRESYAEIVKVERFKSLDPYRVTLSYFNEYENKRVMSHIDDIDGLYGKTLPSEKGHISIYYRRYFPKEIYFIDYKHPDIGSVILLSVFLVIISLAIYFSWKKLIPNSTSTL